MSDLAYGIDFGTSNSVVGVADLRTGACRILNDLPNSDQGVRPSLLYLGADGTRLTGQAAMRTYTSNPHRSRARLLSSIKRFLGDPHFTGTAAPWDPYPLLSPAKLIGYYLEQLKRDADRVVGESVTKVVIGHPVVFPGGNRSMNETLGILHSAAVEAGFIEIEFSPEPFVVAWAQNLGGHVLALDFGGGTFDACLTNDGEELTQEGVAVGGEDLDEVLFRLVLDPVLGFDRQSELNLPASVLGIRTLTDSLHTLRLGRIHDDLALAVDRTGNRNLRLLQRILDGGHIVSLHEELWSTKERLSTAVDATYDLDRAQVEILQDVCQSTYSERAKTVMAQIGETIDRCVGTHHVDALVTTGGSSLTPAFQALVSQRFPNVEHIRSEPRTQVAFGLTQIAYSLWSDQL